MTAPLVIACGALATELRAVLAANKLADMVDVHYLPANLHNRPERIVPELRAIAEAHDLRGRAVLLGYADCGTGGGIDAWIGEVQQAGGTVTRLPGSHCYEFFAGSDLFAALHEAELGTLYLTDFLAKHFEPLMWHGLGLNDHPELLPMYFGHYTRVVWLAQSDSTTVRAAAANAADRLGLRFEERQIGLTPFADAVSVALSGVA